MCLLPKTVISFGLKFSPPNYRECIVTKEIFQGLFQRGFGTNDCWFFILFQQMLENFSQPEFENLQNTMNYDLEHSGKMLVLDKLLSELKNINERIVLISYFTQVSGSIEETKNSLFI